MDPVITVTTQPVVDPQTPTPSHYDEVAAQLMEALDRFVAIIPKLEEAEAADAKQVRKNLNVPEAFCYTTITAAEQLPELEAARKQYAEKNRNRLQYIAAFAPVSDKLLAVSQRITHGLRANKSAVGGESLEIYRVTRAQVKSTRNPALVAHYEAMKRDLAVKRPTKAEREQKKAAKLQEVVEREIAQRQTKALIASQQKEVKAA